MKKTVFTLICLFFFNFLNAQFVDVVDVDGPTQLEVHGNYISLRYFTADITSPL